MSDLKDEKGLKMQVDNLNYYASQGKLEPFFYVLVGMKNLRKYLKTNNLKFAFSSHKKKLNGFP